MVLKKKVLRDGRKADLWKDSFPGLDGTIFLSWYYDDFAKRIPIGEIGGHT